jgi:hypothetical protein
MPSGKKIELVTTPNETTYENDNLPNKKYRIAREMTCGIFLILLIIGEF